MQNDSGDVIICVQEYPEDGDQAVVYFVNLITLEADKHKQCKVYAKHIRAAMQNGSKSTGGVKLICYGDVPKVESHETKLPCFVTDVVTLYG